MKKRCKSKHNMHGKNSLLCSLAYEDLESILTVFKTRNMYKPNQQFERENVRDGNISLKIPLSAGYLEHQMSVHNRFEAVP